MTKLSPHDKALELLKSKGSATPKEIEAYVGLGPYASKYICYLKLHGYEIETVKNGRSVAEYKFISDGDASKRDFKWVPPAKRGAASKPAKVKVAKAAAAPKKAAGKKVAVKAAAKKARPAKSQRPIMDRMIDEVEKTFGSNGEVGYQVDGDFDSMDGIDVNNFLK